MTAFVHPKADERLRCPRIDGHYVPKRCTKIFLALRAAGRRVSYDSLVVDHLRHSAHARKLRELREINREYDAAGRVIWDLVLTHRSGKRHLEFEYNRAPRIQAGDQTDLFAATVKVLGSIGAPFETLAEDLGGVNYRGIRESGLPDDVLSLLGV